MKKVFLKTVSLFLAVSLLSAVPSLAQSVPLLRKLTHKKARIFDMSAREQTVLVTRLGGKVDYLWAVDEWIEAPEHLQWCYDNQGAVRSHTSTRRRR